MPFLAVFRWRVRAVLLAIALRRFRLQLAQMGR